MSEHYYTENPSSEIVELPFETTFKGNRLAFVSVSGVFSHEARIDKASQLLLEAFYPSGAADSLLDVGCGFGPIGLCLKAAYPALAVTLTDINRRAVAYAKTNADRNHLHAETLQGDLYAAIGDRRFGDIVTNPPMAAGKALNMRLIAEATAHLAPGGALWLTCFHNKGGETLRKAMAATFGNVADMEKAGGMRVYRSVIRG